MAERCLVTYTDVDGEVVRRVVTFTANESRIAKCVEEFSLKGQFELERFDESFGETVRIRDSDEVKTGSKLTLVRVKRKEGISVVSADMGSPASIASTVPVLEVLDSTHDSTAGERFILNLPILQEGLSCSSDATSPTGAEISGTSRPSPTAEGTGRSQERATTEASSCDTPNEASADMPSKYQYEKLSGGVFDKFPRLRGQLGSTDAGAWLKRMIKDKFRNMRASTKRKVRDGEKAAPPSIPKKRRVEGMPHYFPADVPGSVEQQRMINALKEATGDELRGLMDATFAARRHAIVDEAAGVEDLRDMYPPLLSSAEVSTTKCL